LSLIQEYRGKLYNFGKLAVGDEDRDQYFAIGESDRMTLKFKKPEAKPAKQGPCDQGAQMKFEFYAIIK